MAVGDLYRVACQYRVHAQLCVNVLYLKNLSAASDDTAAETAQTLCPILGTIYSEVIPDAAGPRNFQVDTSLISRTNSDIGSFIVERPISPVLVNVLPSVNAVTMSIGTGLAGPRRRGRIFLAGVSPEWTEQSVLNVTGFTRYNAWITQMAAAVMGDTPSSGYQLGVFSRASYSLISNPFDDYWKPANRLQVRAPIGTMKSRKVGVGA